MLFREQCNSQPFRKTPPSHNLLLPQFSFQVHKDLLCHCVYWRLVLDGGGKGWDSGEQIRMWSWCLGFHLYPEKPPWRLNSLPFCLFSETSGLITKNLRWLDSWPLCNAIFSFPIFTRYLLLHRHHNIIFSLQWNSLFFNLPDYAFCPHFISKLVSSFSPQEYMLQQLFNYYNNFFFNFLGPHPQHMEVARLGVQSEL